MADIRSKLSELYSLEKIAGGDTLLHRLHPLSKLMVVFCLLICVMSMPRLSVSRLLPFFFYPFIMIAILDIPYSMIVKRTAVTLPFVFFAGISNCIFDREVLFSIGSFGLTSGAISFLGLLIRTILCVSAVLILIASTPLADISGALKLLHVPDILVMLLEMTYRYIGVLADEAANMITAYRLRSGGRKWPKISEFGSFVGQLLLRSFSRAQRVYHAMQCRLYDGNPVTYGKNRRKWQGMDTVFTFSACAALVLLRVVNLTEMIGGLFV